MTETHSTYRLAFPLILLLGLWGLGWANASQSTSVATRTIPIDRWLVAGPLPSPLPAFSEGATRSFGPPALLQFEPVDISSFDPADGNAFSWTGNSGARWRRMESGQNGIELPASGNAPQTAYLAVSLDASRWIAARLRLQSHHPFRIYLDGRPIAAKARGDRGKSKSPAPEVNGSTDLELETGVHHLVIKTVFDPAAAKSWVVGAAIEVGSRLEPEALTVIPEATARMSISCLLDGPKPAGVAVSPDGTYVALSLRETLPPSDDSETWVEVRRVSDGGRVLTLRGEDSINSPAWADGHRLSYITYDKSGGTIWLADILEGGLEPILKNVKGLGDYTWAPDGSFLVYSVSEDPDADLEGVKRLRDLADRQPSWRRREFLYRLTLKGGVRERLTAGDSSTRLSGISPDSRTLLVGRPLIDYQARPYSQAELSGLDLENLQSRVVWKGSWLNDAQWSPDGRSLLMLGGPSLFGDKGTKVARNMIPNEYDGQAYLLDLQTNEVQPLSRDFDPSIDQAFWGPDGKMIYFLATERASRHLYRYGLSDKTWSRIPCGLEVIEQLSLARRSPEAALIASQPNVAPRAYVLDLDSGSVRAVDSPGADASEGISFGRVEPWTFRNKRGQPIDGLVYYPPGFDPSRKYPCIVNYYGGTTPITAEFGGRYPKELYAAQGYVVYVLQPSGAVGFGQNFSALHVNDWGMIVADEIIDGVKKFLADHPFVDARRVGCIGASYGGFMTELLLTRTNIFAAAVSHAGISSIASYWGEGYWGYSYSAVAAAGSFPWNRPDIYVSQSPLFSADKITTPLLLLHGSADTNVPPGESAQLFTALKLLGREVEYVQILDQDHLILTYNKRIAWMKTILAWFDKHLKGQSEWWSHLYPEK
jgi:dipeptidyl aminopeptidase/acylaminoacyl peptidase